MPADRVAAQHLRGCPAPRRRRRPDAQPGPPRRGLGGRARRHRSGLAVRLGGYLAGVLWALREDGVEVPGVDVAVASAVPGRRAVQLGLAGVLARHRPGRAAGAAHRRRGPGPARRRVRARRERGGHGLHGRARPGGVAARRRGQRPAGRQPRRVGRPVPFRLEAAGLVLLVVDTRAPPPGRQRVRGAALGLRARVGVARRADAARGRRPGCRPRPARRPRPGAPRAARRHRDRAGARGRRGAACHRPADLGPLLAASHASLRHDYEVWSPSSTSSSRPLRRQALSVPG